MNDKFVLFRGKYPVFYYDGFHIDLKDEYITVEFDFSIPGLCEFHPQINILKDNLRLLNEYNGNTAQAAVFSLGLVEAVSYWKCACPPRFVIRCGALSGPDKLWWKKLWYNGLGEFFYRNQIETDFESFVNIETEPGRGGLTVSETGSRQESFTSGGINIIPVGGGKDSNVTLELLRELRENNFCFTVNDQPARTESVIAAGYCEKDIVKAYRMIDKELLKRNAEGFLNGHTPFSAIVAFLSYYCAYIIGAENIILSNEASANEVTIGGTGINHQYSKSFEFESDFNAYVNSHFGGDIRYFSLLRAFNELQIAKQFAALKKYHTVFKSCNAGSKKNSWCCSCAKCLFVFIILSPFLEREEVLEIFGCDMLAKKELLEDFNGLAGFSGVKPFECIGTVEEVQCALEMTVKKYKAGNRELPFLLEHYMKSPIGEGVKEPKALLGEFNSQNNISDKFKKYVTEMYEYVSKAD